MILRIQGDRQTLGPIARAVGKGFGNPVSCLGQPLRTRMGISMLKGDWRYAGDRPTLTSLRSVVFGRTVSGMAAAGAMLLGIPIAPGYIPWVTGRDMWCSFSNNGFAKPRIRNGVD